MLKNIAPRAQSRTITNARRLRREMSLTEVLLWRVLHQRPAGLKFRRQHGSGAFVLDYFCSDARLAIEIDGMAHAMGNRPKRDETRDAWFSKAGIATMRIPAEAVLADVGAVVTGIVEEARSRLPLRHPAAPGGPPPRGKLGEDREEP
jgi:very-short-patch-repair endonuclease